MRKSCISKNAQQNHLHKVGCFIYIYFSISPVLNPRKWSLKTVPHAYISCHWKWAATKITGIEFSLFCVGALRTDKSLTLKQVCDNIAVIRYLLTTLKNSWNIVWLSNFFYGIYFLSCKAFLNNGENPSSQRWTKLNKTDYINLLKGQTSLYFCRSLIVAIWRQVRLLK